MVAVRNMKYLFMLYRQQRNNYVARKRRILAAIILKLQKPKQHSFKATQSYKAHDRFAGNFAPEENAEGKDIPKG